MSSAIFWIGLILGAILSFSASVAANLYHEKITRAIEQGKLKFKAKRKQKALEEFELVKNLHRGIADKHFFLISTSMMSVRFLVMGATCLILATVLLGTSKDELRDAADVVQKSSLLSIQFYVAIFSFIPILMLSLLSVFGVLVSLKLRNTVMETGKKLDNIQEYYRYMNETWGVSVEADEIDPTPIDGHS
jgi:hypothetical protein